VYLLFLYSVRRAPRAILGMGLAVALAACGMNAHGTATRPPTILPSPAAIAPSVARTITDADNGATVQVAVGDDIALVLHAPPGADPWQIRSPEPQILAPLTQPGTATPGVTVQTYRAVGPGQAAITAESRPHCSTGGAFPGVIQGFRVIIVVAAP
jgi:predicted secreted protein